jgi:hypothetical protein
MLNSAKKVLLLMLMMMVTGCMIAKSEDAKDPKKNDPNLYPVNPLSGCGGCS